ncbi:NADP-dependent oxidoreductase [Pelomyxa schiedti]|nr:NADP-dependent oxidoreductase [Pelomyxa schiedti]
MRVIEQVGEEFVQSGFDVGDEVILLCKKELVHNGTCAQYCTVTHSMIARKPKNLNFDEAATVPLASLTAWQDLLVLGKLQPGKKALLCTGSGGVGSFAVQIAHYIGAVVGVIGRQSNFEYLRSLGADCVFDIESKNLETEIMTSMGKVDLVLDALSMAYRVAPLIKPGGKLLSIVGYPKLKGAFDFEVHATMVYPEHSELTEIGSLIEIGRIKCPPVETYPMDQVQNALEKLKSGNVKGKLALQIP